MSALGVTADPAAIATATLSTIRPMLVVAARRARTTIAAVTGAAWLVAHDRAAEIRAADPGQVDRLQRQIVDAAIRGVTGPAEPVTRMHRGHTYAVALDDAPAAATATADDPLDWLVAVETAGEMAAARVWHAIALHDALAGSRPVRPAIYGEVASARTLRRRRAIEAVQIRMTGWGWDADLHEPAPEATRNRRAAA
jgi:hypothetical protein